MSSKKYRINMLSHADAVEGHGVLSAGREQVGLVREGLRDRFEVTEGRKMLADITHYHTVNLQFFLGLPLVKARGKAVGYVHFLPETLEGSLKIPRPARAVFNRYLIAFYKSMDRLVVVNPCFISKLEAYGIPRERIEYIPNFVDDSAFYKVSPSEKRQLRLEYGLDPDRFTVVCAGQLQTRKGVLDFAELARRMPEVQFLWAGGFSFGKITDGYAGLCKLIEQRPDNLFFPGMVPREKMNGIYNLGDVMFLPSYAELFPMTILEAMSCHTPLLLRDIDVYPEILFDYYLKGGSNDEFEACLRRLQSDPAYYAQAAEAAARGHRFYSREHVLSMWDAFYTSLVEESAAVRTRHIFSGAHGKRLSA